MVKCTPLIILDQWPTVLRPDEIMSMQASLLVCLYDRMLYTLVNSYHLPATHERQ